MTFLTTVWHWLVAHQVILGKILLSGALLSIINAATTVWKDHPKVVRWLTFILSCLSVLRSRDNATQPGILGILKFPFVPEDKVNGGESKTNPTVLLPFFVTLGLATSSCVATTTGSQFDPKVADEAIVEAVVK